MTGRLTVDRRLARVETDLVNQAKSISAIIERLTAMEAELINNRVYMAREEERDKALQTRLAGIEKSLTGIQGGFNKLLWIIGTAVILAFVAFVIQGGLRPL